MGGLTGLETNTIDVWTEGSYENLEIIPIKF